MLMLWLFCSPYIIGVRDKSRKGPFSSKELSLCHYFRCVCLSACLTVYLSVCLSAWLTDWPSLCLSVCVWLTDWLTDHMSACLSVLFMRWSASQSLCLSAHMFVCLVCTLYLPVCLTTETESLLVIFVTRHLPCLAVNHNWTFLFCVCIKVATSVCKWQTV